MKIILPRLLYLFAALAWLMLLWPNPITTFLAACFSCLTFPFYHHLRQKIGKWRIRLGKKPATFLTRFILGSSGYYPLIFYIVTIVLSLFIPIAALISLVSPQASAGLDRLRQLQANNFQLPPSWVEYFQHLRGILEEYPTIEKVVDEFLTNIDTFFGNAVGILVSRSFDFLGGTMTALWTIFLFFTLTGLFTVYARLIRKITCRIFLLPHSLVMRFIIAIHKALKAIMLGIVLVAIAQGFLCGIGFAVAGVNQPAFWGMLATLVAPIPAVGTALVWVPLCISLWFSGNGVSAIGLGLWGTFAVSGIDNVLRPFFLRQGIKAPFMVLIMVILCGLATFGAVGLIAGPVLLAFSLQAIEEGNHFYKSFR